MDKFLRPERFETDPNDASAAKEWKHWLKTFQNFLEVSDAEKKLEESQKLKLLTNFVSHNIYEFISECEKYEDAKKILEDLYVKPSNEIFSRHMLSTRKQQPSESIDQYLQSLKVLSKNCNFQSVSAETNKNDFIRDAFISGLLSNEIRQRLLENHKLSLEQAVLQSRALEEARKQSDIYLNPHNFVNAVCESAEDTQGQTTSAATFQQCYFCGNNRHPRLKCPARKVTCSNCHKLGHFAKVCMKSNNFKSKSTSAATYHIASASRPVPHSLSQAIVRAKINTIPVNALSFWTMTLHYVAI